MVRQRVDPLSAIAGLLFIGLGVAFALEAAEVVSLDLGWIWPVLLIGLGVGAMLAGASHRRGD